jgi:hypothetical protein
VIFGDTDDTTEAHERRITNLLSLKRNQLTDEGIVFHQSKTDANGARPCGR